MSRLTHSSDGPQEDQEDKKTRLDQLLRELDALLSEDEEDPDDPGTIDDIERKSEEGAQRIRRLIAEKLLEKKQRYAAHSRFTATLETSREFGPRLAVLAHQAGSDHRRDLAVVADGGPWIWQETGKYFPGSVQALDYYHASGHLWEAARSRYGEGTSAAGDWAKTLKDLMYKQKQEQLIQEIRSWQPKTEAKRTVRRRLLNYLQEHRNRMAYKTLKEQSYHIGSGVVEASCKNVVQSRMKQAGMRWSSSGAEAILHTCSHFHSEGNTDFRQYV